MGRVVIDATRTDAVIFDMDGVVTDTAGVHRDAWKELFDAYLVERSAELDEPFEAFTDSDYLRYVDGKPRYDGVASFLASRGIELERGSPDDPPDAETVCGLGNRKNGYFLTRLAEDGAESYPSTLALIEDLREAGVGVGLISSSRNAADVLKAAGVEGLFDVRVDGQVAAKRGLVGKPDPAVFLAAAEDMGAEVARSVVVEDAISGVAAGRRGDFGLVIGVDRGDQADELATAGADEVVSDLADVHLGRPIADTPAALDHAHAVRAQLAEAEPAVFLDYDGTLTPIVDDPARATLSEAVREVVDRLAHHITVAVVSGRDLDDVRGMVALEGIPYAGSHGVDLVDADGQRYQRAEDFLPVLDAAERALGPELEEISGAVLERKRFAIAVHYRQVDDADVGAVETAVDAAVTEHTGLRKTGGKAIFELRPDIDWDKGRALLWFLDMLDLDRPGVVPLYIGDDVTDEDAFAAVPEHGLALVVRGEDDQRLTVADYTLDDPPAVHRFLQELVDLVDNDDTETAGSVTATGADSRARRGGEEPSPEDE